MNSNSNLTITDYKVDPVSQQISEVYINGEKLETGSDPVLSDNVSVTKSTQNTMINVVAPDGYDGMKKISLTLTGSGFALPGSIPKYEFKDEEGNTYSYFIIGMPESVGSEWVAPTKDWWGFYTDIIGQTELYFYSEYYCDLTLEVREIDGKYVFYMSGSDVYYEYVRKA